MMIDNIISLVLKQRVFILVALGLIISGGIFAFKNLPIDAFPDVTNVQVQIITEAAGRSPIEVEKFVTAPIEVQMTGLPGLTELRSLSKFGLSVITVVFEDNVDIYFARQLILERLIEAKDGLPEGSNPVLGPVTTGLGEIYYYTLEFPQGKTHTGSIGDLTDLRTVQDWTVRPLLKNVPGVADINSFGGYVKQYQVIVNPTQLLKYDLTLDEVFNAVSENNNNAGGNVIEHSAEQYVVRGLGLIQSASDIENIVVKVEDKVPVYVKDIADVNVGPEFRQGAMVIDGKREGVGGIVMMTRGGNGKETVALIKKKVSEINKNNILRDGIKIKPYYDRSQLVEACLKTVTDALRDGIILVVIILYLFLRNLRGALVVSLTLPIVILITFIVMWEIGLSANLMSLGGLAISLGMIVDAAIIQIENIQRHFGESLSSGHEENKLAIIRKSVSEVSQPAVFGQLIIAITFIPIITLQGMEGKMFSPLALIVVIAIFASLVVSIFVTPVLASYFLKKDKEKKDRFFNFVKNNYMFLLKNALKHRIVVLISTLFLFLGSMALIPHLGTEFIPVLDEGSMALGIIRLPSVSLSESVEIEKTVERVLMKFPEVQTVVSKIGTAEIATDPEGPNMSDMVVVLKPREEWTTVHTKEELVNEVRESLEQIPGIGFNISQPIALRVDELISGVKSQLAVKLFGDDLGILKDKADEIAQILSSVKGAADLRVEQVSGQSYVEVYINRNRI
ncbi:MAG: efflux RND transporter permease subunit, partial [Candidatus Omnitrophica bacterium]|nr:efflux RND transporter permease subunit [Candidatus Omnitrophota bacterium]